MFKTKLCKKLSLYAKERFDLVFEESECVR